MGGIIMIILNEVSEKIKNILNGTDPEVRAEFPLYNPAFQFLVVTQGYHLDTIANPNGKNMIPVFVSSMGGNFNPVKGLQEGNYTIPINFYFPVRFKNDFYYLASFLGDVFIGSQLDYGTFSGKAISNISAPQFGEIVDLDLKEFKNWVDSTYKKTIDVMEAYMSMQIVLYLSSANTSLVYGNSVVTSLSFEINGVTYTDNSVLFDSSSIQSQSQSQSQQILGESEAAGVPFGTSYGATLKVFYQSNTFYKKLVELWFAGTIQELSLNLSMTIDNQTFSRTCYIESVVLPIQKGQLLAFTITFAKRIED